MIDHLDVENAPRVTAPDGSDVHILLSCEQGGMARFTFPAGETSPAVRHRTVAELWYVVDGHGWLWTSAGAADGFPVHPGVCVVIPVGTSFQVRADASGPLVAVGTTMPPWPGEGEAEIVDGPWQPTLLPGPH